MKFKSFHNHNICLLHFPGQQKNTYADKIDTWSKKITIPKPHDISIVSIMTDDVMDKSPLHKQLTNSDIKYYNVQIGKQWINKHKPRYVVEALKQCPTTFTLVTDGNDVVLVDDLDNLVLPFLSYEKSIIYNATSNRFPDIPLEYIPYVDDAPGIRQVLFGPFCYLNAGVCFGYTQDLIGFYEAVAEATDLENVPSEQYYVRKLFGLNQDKVFFDYDCRMFQAFNRGIEIEEGDDTIIKPTPKRARDRYLDRSKQ